MEKEDIFDKIMRLPILNIFNPFYKRHKEILMYLFFGGCTTLISIFSFAYFNIVLSINELISNVISWILAVLFAFFTNRIWVFQAKTESLHDFIKQMITFYGSRLLTLGMEEAILFIFVSSYQFNSVAIKILAQICVLIGNYIMSKLLVFKSR